MTLPGGFTPRHGGDFMAAARSIQWLKKERDECRLTDGAELTAAGRMIADALETAGREEDRWAYENQYTTWIQLGRVVDPTLTDSEPVDTSLAGGGDVDRVRFLVQGLLAPADKVDAGMQVARALASIDDARQAFLDAKAARKSARAQEEAAQKSLTQKVVEAVHKHGATVGQVQPHSGVSRALVYRWLSGDTSADH